jgi:hypothetical protein
VTDVKTKPHARDRLPTEVPHHPKVLVFAALVTTAALVFMAGWFWRVMTGDGLLITAEQQADARAEEEAAKEEALSDSDLDRRAEAAQPQPTDNPGARGQRGGGVPPAPNGNDPVTTEIELSDWSILAVNDILQIGGEVRNLTGNALSGTVRAYVYIDKVPIATAKTEIQNLRPGAREKVNLVSDSEYKPGTPKVILVEFTPGR